MEADHTHIQHHALFSHSLQHYPGLVAVKDSSLKYVYVNDRFLECTRKNKDEIIGRKEYEIFGLEYRKLADIERRIIVDGETYSYTHALSHNGSVSHLRVLKYRIESDGKVYVVILAHNIDAEVKQQSDLRKNEIYLRTIVDYSDSVMAVLDKQGRIKNFLGSDRIINNPSTAFRILISEIIDTYSSRQIVENIRHVMNSKEELSLKKSLTYKNQEYYLKDNYYPIVNEDGTVSEVGIIRQDISKSREIQEAYTNLVNNSSFGLFIIQEDKIVFVNSRLSEIIGFRTDNIRDRDITLLIKTLVPIVERERVFEEYEKIVENTSLKHSYEFRLYTKSGQLIWVEFMWNRIVYNGHSAIQVALIDITEKKYAVANLEKYKHIVNSSHEGIVFIDDRKTITLANNHILALLKLPSEHIVGKTLDVILGKSVNESALDGMLEECFENGRFQKTEQWLDFPSGERYVEISFNPYIERRNRITGAIIVINDITDEIETDLRMSEIAQNERRKIAMELHDGLTHELLGISINSKILGQQIAATGASVEMVKLVHDIKESLNSAISNAKNLSRGISPIHEQYTSLQTMLEDLVRIVENRYNIECTLTVEDDIEFKDDHILENLYYIIEESVTNAVKHAQTDRVQIDITRQNDFILIKVRDFGSGFTYDSTSAGLGIKFMRMRCRSISASLDIFSEDGSGAVVCCKLKAQ